MPSGNYYSKAEVDAAIAAAVAGLQTQINNETTALTNADTTLTNSLSTETTNRTSADTALGNRITPLETKRVAVKVGAHLEGVLKSRLIIADGPHDALSHQD